MSTTSGQRLVRHVEAWGDAFPPPCACGCGEPTRFTAKGPAKYLNSTHKAWAMDFGAMSAKASEKRLRDDIQIEKFRSAVNGLRESKGMSLSQLAVAGGQQPGWLHCYMFDARYKTIGKDTATAFLRRIAGLPEEASRWQSRTAEPEAARVDAAISEIGVDPDRITYVSPSWRWRKDNREAYAKRLASQKD